MQRAEQNRLLEFLKTGLEKGITPLAKGIMRSPVADYTCPDLLADEQNVFFKKTPLLMGLSPDLPEPGSYWADNASGNPILMVRDQDGQFRAFSNICRHRGVQVVPNGKGKKNRFTCPFHGWSYSTSGDLIAVNREPSFGCIDKSRYGLNELPSAEKYGMLWVRPTGSESIDVDTCLGGLAEDMNTWDFRNIVYGASQTLSADINWKLAIDTFGENYHFDVLHKDTLASSIHGNLQTHDIFDQNYRMVFATTNFKEVQDTVSQDEWIFRRMTLSVYFMYPNTILLMDSFGVDVLRMFPDNDQPGKSRTEQNYYVLPEVLPYVEENPEMFEHRFRDFNNVVYEEDYVMAASSQVGAASGAQTHITFGRNEPALHHYHNAHRRGLGRPILELEAV